MGIVKSILKRPITMVLAILCLLVFGGTSIFSMKMELSPELDMPILLVNVVYPGASPEDINDLVTKPVEDAVGTLSGIKNINSTSRENASIITLEYEYGTDMDKAYSDLRKKIDNVDFPDDADDPSIMEIDMNEEASVVLSVNKLAEENIYSFVNDTLVPEFEKISSVASVDVSGGQESYVRVRLIPEKMDQYNLTMGDISQAIQAADFTFPLGNTKEGTQELSISAEVKIEDTNSLKKVPLVTGNGKTINLEDVADVSEAAKEKDSIGRYNGEDTITLSIKKQQQSSAVDVSEDVKKTISNLEKKYPGTEFIVVDDASDEILSSLSDVRNTMITAVIIAMIVIFLFFGDWKASLIVGSSMPVSMLISLIMMSAMGFSLNVITMSSIVLAIGNMTDDSIVVLDSCFKEQKGKGFKAYMAAAVNGTSNVFAATIGGAITNSVVYIPLAFLEGMAGQTFIALGFTLMFTSLSSAISGLTIVPMCYLNLRPEEKRNSPVGSIVKVLQNGYEKLIAKILDHKAIAMSVSVFLLVGTVVLATTLGVELMPSTDSGTIEVSVETRPGISIGKVDELLKKVESVITNEEDIDSYITSYGESGLSSGSSNAGIITVYLKSDRKLSTIEIKNKWREEMNQIPDCSITLESPSSMNVSSNNSEFEVILQSAQLDEVKNASEQMVAELSKRPELIKVHSDLENAAPVIKVHVDPIKTAAEGTTPNGVSSLIHGMLSGYEATTMTVSGDEISVMVEYPDNSYDTINKVKGILIPNGSGGSVALTDIADINYEDSPSSISRKNKEYIVTITGSFTDLVNTEEDKETVVQNINENIVNKYLDTTVTRAQNSLDESIAEEITGLLIAILTAIFLLFVVMAAQFESIKLSIMVMTAIPFSMIGAIALMAATGSKIGMTTMLGFLMLVGAVVKSGILYVETVDQYQETMEKRSAVIKAGVNRFRSILMTMLIAVVSILPLIFGGGEGSEIMRGVSIVMASGQLTSTALTLLLLPVYYSIMTRKKDKNKKLDED
ncbi:efflux RND transporter permease subunit [Lacrimispora sp.]|uniref:efflux RND transporter permease subunit n=1 Tax=Lacrimispora sp. TaxID=2719234 RepID=UPI0028AD5750|nr:efflux RND transporter permease subunit [Lacrimispora sp.]